MVILNRSPMPKTISKMLDFYFCLVPALTRSLIQLKSIVEK